MQEEVATPVNGESKNHADDQDEEGEEESLNEELHAVMEYESMYQPKRRGRKPQTRGTDTTFFTLHTFRDHFSTEEPLNRANSAYLIKMLLLLEDEFSTYLHGRECRWIDKASRAKLREEMPKHLTE